MFGKKAIGIEWYALIIALVVGAGIIIYSVFSVQIPKVGEYSLSMGKTFESKAIIPTVIDSFMELINKRAIKALDENKIFVLKNFCEDSYTGHIGDTQNLKGTDADEKFGGLKDKDTKCIIDEPELRNHFSEIFNYEYNNFNPKKFSDFDLSDARYRVSVQKEEEAYFIKGETNDMVSAPIIIEEGFGKEKEIGNFYLNGSFKIPTDYAFDDPEKARCILSVDCAADCDDVMNAGYGGEIKENSCSYYGIYPNDCVVVKDDFGKIYPCGKGPFCEGNCCDNHCYDLKCGEPNDCGTPCGDNCDAGCPDASACGMCGNPECPPPEEEPHEQLPENPPEESGAVKE